MGDPQPSVGASRRPLTRKFPGQKFGVVNRHHRHPARTSSADRPRYAWPMARELMSQLIYMGNNRMVGPFRPRRCLVRVPAIAGGAGNLAIETRVGNCWQSNGTAQPWRQTDQYLVGRDEDVLQTRFRRMMRGAGR